MYNQTGMNSGETMGIAARVPEKVAGRIAEYLYMKNIGIVTKYNKLSEKPRVWVHMCMHTAIQIYSPKLLVLGEYDVVEYIYCPACGALTYYY